MGSSPAKGSPPPPGEDPSGPYMRQLDGLRAFAVLAVTWSHFAPASWQLDVRWGKLGVWLFFVLSGFLITGILLRARGWIEEGTQGLGYSVRQFFARRFLRIFPLYYAAIAAGLALGLEGVRETLAWELTYTMNFLIAFRGWQQPGHFWSLAVEEQFYLVWPWLVLGLSRRALERVLFGAVLLAPCLRLALAAAAGAGHADPYAATYLTPSCLDALGAGALLAFSDQQHGAGRVDRMTRSWLLAGATGLALLQAVQWTRGDSLVLECLQYAPASLAFGWLVWRASRGFGGRAGQVLSWGPLVRVGQISYGVYVLHPFVKELFDRLVGPLGLGLTRAGLVNLVVLHALTFGAAWLSWRFFEGPLNEQKRLFPYRRPRAGVRTA